MKHNIIKNILLLLFIFSTLTTATTAWAECPSNDEDFCLAYKFAQQGDAGAQYNLGVMYDNGIDVESVYDELQRFYNLKRDEFESKSLSFGDVKRHYDGLNDAEKEQLLEKIRSKFPAVALSPKSEIQPYIQAQPLDVQDSIGKQEGVAQDKHEAVRWYHKAAEQGHAKAQYNLGLIYAKGEGAAQDLREAVSWFRKAAEQGHAKAQYNLGLIYAKGKGVAQDLREAARWYRKVAEQGHAKAQYNLGYMYAKGEGVTQDLREAVRWFRKAAEQGHAKAQYNLGYMYAEGEGVAQDLREAARWYRKVAEQGYAKAQYILGYMYAKGKGIITDKREAYIWYSIAKANGSKKATDALDEFDSGKLLTTVETKLARREAVRRLKVIDKRKADSEK